MNTSFFIFYSSRWGTRKGKMIENIFNFLDWEYWSYRICCDLWWWWRWWGWILMLRIFSIQQDWANFQIFWMENVVIVFGWWRWWLWGGVSEFKHWEYFQLLRCMFGGTCGGRWKIGRSGGEMMVVVLEVVFWNVGCVVEVVRKSMCFYEWKKNSELKI